MNRTEKLNGFKNMPLLNIISEEFVKDKALKGINITLSIHLEAKTAFGKDPCGGRGKCFNYRQQSLVYTGRHSCCA